MKNKFTFVMICLVLFGSSVFSQTATLPTTTASPGETISLPLNVTGFTDIGSITLHIQIDPAILTFAGITGAPSGTFAGVSGNTVSISWAELIPITIGAAGTGTLLNLLFDYTGPGTSTLNFLPTSEIIQMPGYLVLPVTYTNGLVTPNMTNTTKATLFSVCATTGATVAVPIKYEGFGSTVGSITQKVQYDPAKLTFLGVDMIGNLAGGLASASGGIVTIAWENLLGASINYPDNQFLINFTYTGTTSTDLIFYPGCLITTNAAVNIPVSYFNTTINPVPAFSVGVASASQTVCSGVAPLPLSSTGPFGGSGSYLYQWQSSLPGGTWSDIAGATTNAYTPGVLATTTLFHLTQMDAVCGYTLNTNDVTITVYDPLAAGTVDDSQTICNGATPLTFTTTVAPSGGSGVYTLQWETSLPGGSWSAITGATTGIYNPGPLTTTTLFRKKVTDVTCGDVEYSNTLTVTVYDLLSVGAVGNSQTICNGATPMPLITTVAPSGGSGAYTVQWETKLPGGSWSPISGATTASYAPGALTTTTMYRKYVADATCPESGYTNELTITVYPLLAVGTVAASQTICNGATPLPLVTTVAPSGGSGAYTVQWETSLPGGSWSTIPGATLATYTPGALTTTTLFRKYVADVTCPESGYTNVLTVSVYPVLAVGSVAASQTICNGATPLPLVTTVAPSGGSGAYNVQWETKLPGGNWSLISGATTATYTPGALTTTTLFRKYVEDVTCPESGYTNELTISVYPVLAVGTVASSQTICNGATPLPLVTTVAPSGGSGAYNVQWETKLPGGNWSLISGATTATYTPGALTTTTLFRKYVEDVTCPESGYTNELTISVYPVLAVGTVASSQTICNGATPLPLVTTVAPSGGSGSYTVQWETSLPGGSWSAIPGATLATYTPGALTTTTLYRKYVEDVTCPESGYTNELTISVYPVLAVGTVAASQTICNGATPLPLITTVAPSGGSGSYSVQWETSLPGGSWSAIPGATLATYAPGALTTTTLFRKMVTDVTCSHMGYTNELTITVYPVLNVGAVAASQTICYGATPAPLTTTVAPSGGSGSYTVQWETSLPGGSWSAIPGATLATYAPGALTTTTLYRKYVADVTCPESGYTNELTITVNPLPLITAVALQSSTTGVAPWDPIAGSLSAGYTMCIDAVNPYYYLDINTLTVNIPLLSTAFSQNGFYLNTTSLPPTWTAYWDAKGVNASAAPGTWQAVMYQIILGNQPMFYISYTGTDYQLIDGMQYQFDGTVATLRVTGDYPQWMYTYNGTVTAANTCVSDPMTVMITFNTTPAAPVVTVVNNCGNSVLSTTGVTGATFLWSTGETTSSITVTVPGTYTVVQTSPQGCTSLPGSGVAAPKVIPAAPVVTVVNDCGFSTLTATGVAGATFLWSTGETTASITVTVAGLYTVTQTSPEGCLSPAGSGTAAPLIIPPAPTVTVVDDCGFSVLTATGQTGATFLWSTGETTATITVTVAGPYTVTQTVGGCTSLPGTGTAAPLVIPPAPTVTVVDDCGFSTLTATGQTGATFLWSTGETTATITVTVAGPYTVTQTVGGCTSLPGTGTAAPLVIPAPPVVTVVNNCGSSVLTATGLTGATFLWSTGATTSVITVTTAGTYSVTQTVGGCTSLPGSGTAAPLVIPPAPTVTVVNNCGNSVLTATGQTGATFLWSTGATTAAITVTTAGTYTVTQTVGGCTSLPGSGVAAPIAIPPAPTVTVVNNCGNSVLTATGLTGATFLWSTGATTAAITVTVAGPYTVTQTLAGCTSAPGTGTAAPLIIPPAPTVTVVNNCGNSVLTATGQTGATFLWSTGATTAAITVTTAGTYNVTQTVGGCTSLPGSGVAAPKPIPVPTITGNAAACVGSTGNVYTTETGMTNYVWTVSAGGTITAGGGSTNNTVTVTWNTAGAQTVSVNYTNSAGCTGTAATVRAVTVNPLPVPTISGPSSACQNATGNVYTTQTGMTNYVWTVSAGGTITAGGTSTSNSVTVTWTTPGPKTVTVNYTNANGCTGATPTSFSVNVNPTPVPSINIYNNDPCVGASGNQFYTEGGMSNYVWTITSGGVITAGQGTSAITVSWIGQGLQTITLTYVSAVGCPTTTPSSYTMLIGTPPAAANAITGSTSVCAGATGVAYSTTPVAGANSYAWTVPAGATIASGAGTLAITVNFSASATSGNVTVAGVNDCGPGTPSTLAVTVNQLPGPAGTITGPNQICAPATGKVYTVPAIANATTYSWTVPAGATIVSGGTTNSITVNFSASASSGAITVFGVNACGNGTVSPNFNVTVTPTPPTPVITENGNILTSSAPTGNQWYLNGVLIPGATGQTYEPTQSGIYTVIVTINGCSSAVSNEINFIMPGIAEPGAGTFAIYPVPNDGHFTLSIEIPGTKLFTIQVYNQIGERLVELRDVEVSGKMTKEIDLRPVPKGVYSIVFRTNEYSIIRKVIVY